MANVFKSTGVNAVGTSSTAVYVTPAATTTTIIGMSVANVIGTTVNVDVTLKKGASTFYVVKNAPVPPGGTLIAIGGDQKVVLETGNEIRVLSNIAASVDSIVSVLEIS